MHIFGGTAPTPGLYTSAAAPAYSGEDMPRPYFAASNSYETMLGTPNSSAAAHLANYTYMLPFIPYQNRTYTELACVVMTAAAAGKLLRIGLYNANQTTMQPTTVLADSGAIAADATGRKTYTISQALTAGTLYYLNFISDGTPSVVAIIPSSFAGVIMYSTSGSAGGALARNRGSFGALPDESANTFFISGDAQNTVPLVGIR